MPPPLPEVVIEPIVRMALAEDFGRAGDVTSDAIIPTKDNARFVFRARERGVIAGLDAARLAARMVDRNLAVSAANGDGALVAVGEVFAEIGLDLKRNKPLNDHFTISLANGYNGYLPTPEHHRLGGYETWRARSSYLETDASVQITAQLKEMLAELAAR